jgi:hypothetical protein
MQLLGWQVVQLQKNVIFLRSDTTKFSRFELTETLCFHDLTHYYRPSRISMVIARDTTSREAKSLATGA